MAGAKKPEGVFNRLVRQLDERVSIKLMMRVWGPRLEIVVRLMLVATFFDDSFRMATNFSKQTDQVGEQGCLKWLAIISPEFAVVNATVVLVAGLLAQWIGSLCLLASLHPDGATKALIGWVIAQPFLYGQLSNFDFVAKSLSLVGGLLVLRASLVSELVKYRVVARTKLFGRLLLPTAYLYQAGRFLFSALTLDETIGFVAYVKSLSMFVVNAAVLAGLLICSAFVAAGLKSRTVALLLALVNLGIVFYQHPFFRFVWLEGGEWKYDNLMPMPHIVLPTNVSPLDFELWEIYDLHRYNFFLGISTSGALLLLAQYGPGEIAIQKNELLLPYVSRAQD